MTITRDYILYGVIALLIIILFVDRCSSKNDLDKLADQIGRLNDTTITTRIVDGKPVADTKAAGLTINEYRSADPGNFAAFEKMIGKKDELISTLILEITNERRRGEAPVLVDSAGVITVPFEDSCITAKTTVPKKGNAIFEYQWKPQTYKAAAVMQREKWYLPKQPVATGTISGGCGKISGQKIVLITPEKKKVAQTGLFKGAVVIVAFEALRFLITGKL